MSPQEIENASLRIAGLKLDPREDSRIRALLVRADLLYRELTGNNREQIELLIHGFEEALELRDSAQIEEMFRLLKAFCDSHDQSNPW